MPELTSAHLAYMCAMKISTSLFAVEIARKVETDHSACVPVLGTLARKELFLVQIL